MLRRNPVYRIRPLVVAPMSVSLASLGCTEWCGGDWL